MIYAVQFYFHSVMMFSTLFKFRPIADDEIHTSGGFVAFLISSVKSSFVPILLSLNSAWKSLLHLKISYYCNEDMHLIIVRKKHLKFGADLLEKD